MENMTFLPKISYGNGVDPTPPVMCFLIEPFPKGPLPTFGGPPRESIHVCEICAKVRKDMRTLCIGLMLTLIL